MALTRDTKLGPYEIESPLGAGGMGEVYCARNTRLGRTVAVKVLPSAFSNDQDRLRRFEHEARLLSTLNHPSLLAIYDVGSQDGAVQMANGLAAAACAGRSWEWAACSMDDTLFVLRSITLLVRSFCGTCPTSRFMDNEKQAADSLIDLSETDRV